MLWQPGDVILRREICWGEPSIAIPSYVVEHSPELLVTFFPSGTPIAYADMVWPTSETGRHPWWPRAAWEGHGVLMLHRPGDAYSVWHFWTGHDRDFWCWYINLQRPFVTNSIGFDTEDHELDIVIGPDRQWGFKDSEALADLVAKGRYTAELEAEVRRVGDEVAAMIETETEWWDHAWTTWSPPTDWETPLMPDPSWVDVEFVP